MIYWTSWFLAGLWIRLCYRLKVVGLENIPAEGGVVLAGNHSSYLDPIMLGCAHRRRTTFIARLSLERNPVYRFLKDGLGIVSIDRDRGDKETLRLLTKLLREGRCCALFPEGTRSADGKVKTLKRGFSLFAKRAGVPVVPVWIEGAYHVWPRQRKLPRPFGRIEVRFGPAFTIDDPREGPIRLKSAFERLAGETNEKDTTVSANAENAPREGDDGDQPTARGCGAATEKRLVVGAHPIS